MSRDSNLVFLIGRLTRDPVVTFTQSGKQMTKFSVAVSHGKESVSFFDVVAWENVADAIGRYLHKGDQIGIDGSLKQNRYTGTDGQNYSKVEVQVEKAQFLAKKGSGSSQGPEPSQVPPQPPANHKPPDSRRPGFAIELLDDDEVPF